MSRRYGPRFIFQINHLAPTPAPFIYIEQPMVTAWFCLSEFIWMLMLAGLHKAMSKNQET